MRLRNIRWEKTTLNSTLKKEEAETNYNVDVAFLENFMKAETK